MQILDLRSTGAIAARLAAVLALLASLAACAGQPQGSSNTLPAAHGNQDSAAAIMERLRGPRRSHGR